MILEFLNDNGIDLMNYDENVCIMLNGLLKFVNDDDVVLGKVKTKNKKKDNKLTKETSQNISMMKDINAVRNNDRRFHCML